MNFVAIFTGRLGQGADGQPSTRAPQSFHTSKQKTLLRNMTVEQFGSQDEHSSLKEGKSFSGSVSWWRCSPQNPTRLLTCCAVRSAFA